MATIRKRILSRQAHTELHAKAEEPASFVYNDIPIGERPLSSLTVGDLVAKYRDEVTVRKLSRHSETYILNAFLREKIAAIPLTKIRLADFHTYRYARLEKVKPGTVNREIGIIKHAFDVAMHEWGIPLKENPLKRMKKMRPQNGRTRRLEPGELEMLETFFSSIRNPYLVPMIHFAIETAMRRGEILAMKWKDINYRNNTLHIPVTKNGYSRIIPLTDRALDILQSLPSTHSEHVFPTSSNAAKMAWQRLIERTDIDDLHFHDLRHEAISRLFEKGLSVPEVALISGHRDYRMLFRYTHLKPEDLAKKLRTLVN